jgi:hypothetical protein
MGSPRSSARRGARLGLTEADAFLTRLELLSADITEPLAQVYGAITDPDRLATDLVLDALPPEARALFCGNILQLVNHSP